MASKTCCQMKTFADTHARTLTERNQCQSPECTATALNHPHQPRLGPPTKPLPTVQKLSISSGCTPISHLSCGVVCLQPHLLDGPWTYLVVMCVVHPSLPRHPAAPISAPASCCWCPGWTHVVHPLALSGAAGLLCPPCGAAPWPVQVLGPPLAPSSSPACGAAPSQAEPEEHLKVNNEVSRKLYSPYRTRHPQISQLLQRL